MKGKKSLVLALLCLLLFTPSLLALDPVNKTFFKGVAIDGYDPVSYFTVGKAQEGKDKYEYVYKEAMWWFVSQQNLNLFKKNPGKYMPQYGGYCAWAVSEGYTADIDPDSWKIINKKLYLNYNQSIQKKWEKTIADHIKKADKNWPKLLKE